MKSPRRKVFPLITTLNRICAWCPCPEGWEEGLTAAGKSEPDDDPVSYEEILDAVGLESALWCCRAEPQYEIFWRRYAIWCARKVQDLAGDARSIAALDTADRYVDGEATEEELATSMAAARDSVSGADSGSWLAREAAWRAAMLPAWSAANSSWIATRVAAEAGLGAIESAQSAQSEAFRQLVTTGTLP